MKKIMIAACIFLAGATGYVRAQWNTSGSNIYNSNTGNVGIGTSSPGQLLTVSGGNISLSNNNYLTSGSNRIFWQYPSAQLNTYTRCILSQNIYWDATTSQWYVPSTSSPDFSMVRLENSGQMGFFTHPYVNDYNGNYVGSNPNSDATLENYRRMTIKNNGYVGVGIASPLSLFHIADPGASKDAIGGVNGALTIQANIPGPTARSITSGAEIEFAIPRNNNGTNAWGQARIITIAGNATDNDATGKMILGTRRYFNKVSAGSNWYYGDDITIDGAGNVGIGTAGPQAQLDINGELTLGGGSANLDPAAPNPISISYLQNSGKFLVGWNRSGGNGETDFISNRGAGSAGGFNFYDYSNSGGTLTNLLSINATTGTVLIGQPTSGNPASTGYILDVKGKVRVNQLTVNTTGGDFVFEPGYKLIPLNELSQFVRLNHHLPGIAPAKQMQKDGIEVGDSQAKLLQKIEELTLYIIEQDKMMKEQAQTAQKQAQAAQEQNKIVVEQGKLLQQQQVLLLKMQKELDKLKK
jgi:hypothetical protein